MHPPPAWVISYFDCTLQSHRDGNNMLKVKTRERERLENGQATAKNRRQPIIPYQQFGVRVTLWYRSWWHRLC